jgi:cation diffusion facilitator CzcD-associated flavoprotein CzcO
LETFCPKYCFESLIFHIKNNLVLSDVDLTIVASADVTPNSSTPTLPSNWVPIREQYRGKPRTLKVITIGTGFSGLTMAYKIQHQYKLGDTIEHVIYEKNPDIGGTWYENQYPGVGCDTPAHIYTFSWEPNPDWSSFHVSGPEIHAYIKRTAAKYNLTRDVQLNCKVVGAEWNELDGKWHVRIEQKGKIIQDVGDILVNGCGVLNNWQWPNIEGLKDFQGHLVHTAHWKDGYNFQGKKIGLIGNGSSAIQILPEIQAIAAHVTIFIRTPTWICSNFSAQYARADGKNFNYTEERKAEFRSNPKKLFELRKSIEHTMNKFFVTYLKDSPEQAAARESAEQLMLKRLGGNKELSEKLIPEWGVGCRRPTPGDGYLEALTAENVEVTISDIARITKIGVQTVDNKHHNLDAIICATGFDVSFRPAWKLIGRNGADLAQIWETDPEGYFGIAAHGFPNYFVFVGPNYPVSHGSLLACMEFSADYILKWIKKIQEEDIHSIDVTKGAVDDYNTYTQEFMKRTVWISSCRSWYKNHKKDGKIMAMYPGSVVHYKEMLDVLRGEDFAIKYNTKNRFSFMGNGFTRREINGEDLSFYLEK